MVIYKSIVFYIILNIIRTSISACMRPYKCTAITPINKATIVRANTYEHNTNTLLTAVDTSTRACISKQ